MPGCSCKCSTDRLLRLLKILKRLLAGIPLLLLSLVVSHRVVQDVVDFLTVNGIGANCNIGALPFHNDDDLAFLREQFNDPPGVSLNLGERKMLRDNLTHDGDSFNTLNITRYANTSNTTFRYVSSEKRVASQNLRTNPGSWVIRIVAAVRAPHSEGSTAAESAIRYSGPQSIC
jgi:hypothetical protein